jgi:hypothetical protein
MVIHAGPLPAGSPAAAPLAVSEDGLYVSYALQRCGDLVAALSGLRHGLQVVTSNRNASGLFACKWLRAPATMKNEGLAAAEDGVTK